MEKRDSHYLGNGGYPIAAVSPREAQNIFLYEVFFACRRETRGNMTPATGLEPKIMIFPRVDKAAYKPASVGERKCLAKITSIVNSEVNANENAITGRENPIISFKFSGDSGRDPMRSRQNHQ